MRNQSDPLGIRRVRLHFDWGIYIYILETMGGMYNGALSPPLPHVKFELGEFELRDLGSRVRITRVRIRRVRIREFSVTGDGGSKITGDPKLPRTRTRSDSE